MRKNSVFLSEGRVNRGSLTSFLKEAKVGTNFKVTFRCVCLLHYVAHITFNSPSMIATENTESEVRMVTKYFQINLLHCSAT